MKRVLLVVLVIAGLCAVSGCEKGEDAGGGEAAEASQEDGEASEEGGEKAEEKEASTVPEGTELPVRVVEYPAEFENLHAWTHVEGSDDVYAISGSTPLIAHFKLEEPGVLAFAEKVEVKWDEDGIGALAVTNGGKDVWVKKVMSPKAHPEILLERDPETGKLTEKGEGYFQMGTSNLATSPDGEFVYTSAKGGVNVSKRADDKFEKIQTASLGSGLQAVAMSRDGDFIYAATKGPSLMANKKAPPALFVLERDSETGEVEVVEKHEGKVGDYDLEEGKFSALAVSSDDETLYGFHAPDGFKAGKLVAMDIDPESGKVSVREAKTVGFTGEAFADAELAENNPGDHLFGVPSPEQFFIIDDHLFIDAEHLKGPAVYALK